MGEDVSIETYTKLIICDILDCPMARGPVFEPENGEKYRHCGSCPCILKIINPPLIKGELEY